MGVGGGIPPSRWATRDADFALRGGGEGEEKGKEEKADPSGKGGLRDDMYFNFVVTLWKASGLKA